MVTKAGLTVFVNYELSLRRAMTIWKIFVSHGNLFNKSNMIKGRYIISLIKTNNYLLRRGRRKIELFHLVTGFTSEPTNQKK